LLIAFYLSFVDKKGLTNEIVWNIFRAMNANEIVLKTNPRLSRIKKVSGIFKWMFFVVALFTTFIGLGIAVQILTGHRFEYVLNSHAEVIRELIGSWAEAGCRIAEAVCAWFCFQLFGLYSRGELFTSKIVYYIRWVGCAYLVKALLEVSYRMILIHPTRQLPPLGFMLCLAYLLALIFSLFPGFLILFLAWISDEGRKIQEEQELTV
jgi:hypothetical protein